MDLNACIIDVAYNFNLTESNHDKNLKTFI